MSVTYSSSKVKASGRWPPRFPRVRSSYLPRQTTQQQPHLGRIQKQLSSFAKRAINKHLQMAATSNPASLASSAPSSPKLPPPALMGTDVDARLPSTVVPLPPIDGESQPDQPNYTHVHHVIHQLHAGLPPARLWPQMPGINHEVPYARSTSSTAPTSPRIPPIRQNSGTSASSGTPRMRPHATTLNVPGMTRSRASPDGKIASRDVGAKLVIIMVGLPARGKSYLTKKMQRFFSWQQHDCQVFNVGNRRRVEVTTPSQSKPNVQPKADLTSASQDASVFVNGTRVPIPEPTEFDLNSTLPESKRSNERPIIDQSASFFDPENQEAAKQREKFAMDSLDELLDYLLIKGGSVGILDATNSTISRRKALVQRIQQREPKLNFIFVESECHDPKLLEANMRLKLSGPDYKGKDPVKSLADFKERIKAYEKAYEPIGDWEESKGFQYIKDIDVGRKMVTHQLQGFFSAALANYLSSFHLSPRQIWIARHGQSFDNVLLKLGGDSDLTDRGRAYGVALYNFITHKRQEWLTEQKNKIARASFPPVPGDQTPPYPEHYSTDLDEKNFCVWTSTLRRSVDTAEAFEKDDDYDVKQWSWLNDMHTGDFEGMSYDQIQRSFPEEYEKRRLDKLHYVYPGVGGEGYLQVIARLREMIREIERIKDHVCIISHRSICRVLLAYFKGLSTDFITDMSIPLGRIFSIEPKPYGTDFHVYQYNEATGWFDEEPESVIYKTMDPNA